MSPRDLSRKCIALPSRPCPHAVFPQAPDSAFSAGSAPRSRPRVHCPLAIDPREALRPATYRSVCGPPSVGVPQGSPRSCQFAASCCGHPPEVCCLNERWSKRRCHTCRQPWQGLIRPSTICCGCSLALMSSCNTRIAVIVAGSMRPVTWTALAAATVAGETLGGGRRLMMLNMNCTSRTSSLLLSAGWAPTTPSTLKKNWQFRVRRVRCKEMSHNPLLFFAARCSSHVCPAPCLIMSLPSGQAQAPSPGTTTHDIRDSPGPPPAGSGSVRASFRHRAPCLKSATRPIRLLPSAPTQSTIQAVAASRRLK